MAYTRFNQGILGGVLLLVVSVVNAQDYPAADFQPKVLFRDESVAVSEAPSAAAPCESQQQAVASKKQEVVENDPQYPASNFQPKVIFSQGN